MCDNWAIAKEDLINRYFQDDLYMQSIAKMTFMGKCYYQEVFADWFENHSQPAIAEFWMHKAKLIRKEKGFDVSDV